MPKMFSVALVLFVMLLAVSQSLGQIHSVGKVNFEVSIVPEKTVIMLGEPIHLAFTVRNLSDDDFWFNEGGDYRNRLGRPENYDVRAVNVDGKQVPKPEILFSMGGLSGAIKVPAKAVVTRDLFLPHWAPFEEAGIYTIICSRNLYIHMDKRREASELENVFVKAAAPLEVVAYDRERIGKVIGHLGEKLLDKDEEIARQAALSLDYFDDERVIPLLNNAMDSVNDGLMRMLLSTLGRYSSDAAIEGIKKAMRYGPEKIRNAGNPETATLFAERVRLSAVDALKESKHPNALSLLVSMKGDDYWVVRLRVVESLGKMEAPETVELLQAMANDENEEVRKQVAQCLSKKRK